MQQQWERCTCTVRRLRYHQRQSPSYAPPETRISIRSTSRQHPSPRAVSEGMESVSTYRWRGYSSDQTEDSRNTEGGKKCKIRDKVVGVEGKSLLMFLGNCVRTIPPRGLQGKGGGRLGTNLRARRLRGLPQYSDF